MSLRLSFAKTWESRGKIGRNVRIGLHYNKVR